MEQRLGKTKNNLIEDVMQNTAKNSWTNINRIIHENNGTDVTTSKTHREIIMDTKFKQRLEQDAVGKSKVNFLLQGIKEWTPGKRQKYLSKLNRIESNEIFKLRTRMTKIKRNYKGAYRNLTCRGCNATEETQKHVLEECTSIHQDETTKIYEEQYFTDNIDMLKETVKKIKPILARLEQSEAPPESGEGQPGTRDSTR